MRFEFVNQKECETGDFLNCEDGERKRGIKDSQIEGGGSDDRDRDRDRDSRSSSSSSSSIFQSIETIAVLDIVSTS